MFSPIKIIICILFYLSNLTANGQIDPFTGIIQADSCDFTTNCGFVTVPSNDLWQQGIANKNILQSNQVVLITDTLSTYPINASNSIEIHWPVYTHSFFNFILTFEHSMHTTEYQDGGKIEISYDYGQNWLSVEDDYNSNIAVNKENFYGPFDTLFDGSQGFSGQFSNQTSAIQWVWILPLKDMPTDTMYYRFKFISDSIDENMDGWMIHNLKFSFAEIDGGIIEDKVQSNLFDLWPTSNNYQFEIITQINDFKVDILNQYGQLMKTLKNEKAIDLSGFSHGFYLITFHTSSGQCQTRRLCIN